MNRLILYFIFLLFVVSCSKSIDNSDFSYDLIPVSLDGKWGYIDKSGKYLINPQFSMANLFKEDLAVVANEDSLLGYIDKKGNYAIKPIFLWATNFSEGLAFTTKRNGYITCIDSKGTVKFTLKEAESVEEFSENLALVKVSGKFGYIDKSGKFVIKPQFDIAQSFKEGLAVVGKYKEKGHPDRDSYLTGVNYGFIDKKGNLKINYQFKSAENFSEGLATVSISDNEYGVINSEGKYVIPPKYGYILPFKNGLAAFNLSQDGGMSSNRGFLDKEGKIIINPQYNESGNFSNSLAPAKTGNLFGFIDKKGKYIINPQFENASDFHSGIAAVKIGQKIGFINEKGEYLVTPQFTNTFSSAFNVIRDFNGEYRGDFDFAQTDYYDTDKLVKELFKLSNKSGLFGLYKNVKLEDIIRNDIFNNLKYGNDPVEIKNDNIVPLVDGVIITNVKMSFDKFVYINTSNSTDFNFYNFQRNQDKIINNNAKLSYVEVYLDLFNDAVHKEQIIAERIQKELKKRYGIETNYDSNSKTLMGIDVNNLEISFYFNSIENTFD